MAIRFLTAGESHGPMLTAILEGIPAGLPLKLEDINIDLARRQKGFGSGGRMRIESDQAQITSGVVQGKTTGSPIALLVENRDYKNWREKDIVPVTTPRPGHADLTGAIKYGYQELRLSLERASARETTMRVAVGGICKKLLSEMGVSIGGYVKQIGSISTDLPENLSWDEIFARSEESEVRCPHPESGEKMKEEIRQTMKAQDTLGGIFTVVAINTPPGLGSYVHYDRRLDAALAQAMLSIPAMKGVEIGDGFANALKRGSEVHDKITLEEGGRLGRESNRAGGVEGGISTGEPLIVSVAMKPISTVVKGINSVNLATGKPELTTYERSDFCALPRAVPIGEAMMAIVLTQFLSEKIGGDSLDEMKLRVSQLRRSHVDDLPMDNCPWRFGYYYD